MSPPTGAESGAEAAAMLAAPARGLRPALQAAGLGAWAQPLIHSSRAAYKAAPHGHRAAWQNRLIHLPEITPSGYDFNAAAIRIGAPQDATAAARAQLKAALLQLSPWRKGPFELFGLVVDSEWRSNLKWQRLAAALSDLRGRRVLDVGCGNGYSLWRMLGQGARLALGIDPSQLFLAQFAALKRYCRGAAAFMLPLKCEQLPRIGGRGAMGAMGYRGDSADGFDTVFSMGVLYHRGHPLDHLRELLAAARPGGEVVVETLSVAGGVDSVLRPAARYAKMRNVRAIPSPLALEKWLRQAGAVNIRCVDISLTTAAEQRRTEWMQFQSLTDFLDPADAAKTIDGHPAPRRAIFIGQKPD